MTKKQEAIINRVLKGYGERKTIACFKTAEPERQYITDGVSCFCLYEDFVDDEREEMFDKIGIIRAYEGYWCAQAFEAPDIADLKAMCKQDKAAKYDFGPNAPRVSARRLSDLLEFFTKPIIFTTMYKRLPEHPMKDNPIRIKNVDGEQGYALLYPYYK